MKKIEQDKFEWFRNKHRDLINTYEERENLNINIKEIFEELENKKITVEKASKDDVFKIVFFYCKRKKDEKNIKNVFTK